MRFFDSSVAALLALASTAVAAPQDAYSGVTSATSVVTITRYVSRVVQTEYATRTSTSTSSTPTPPVYSPAPTGMIPAPYHGNNGTKPSVPSAVPSSPSTTPASPSPYIGAAAMVGVESFGVAAVAGIVAFLAL